MKVGELNGRWATLFKTTLSVAALGIPLGVGLLGWVLVQIVDLKTKTAVTNSRVEQFIAAGPRYTTNDAKADFALLRVEVERRDMILREWVREGWPPKELLDRIDLIEKRLHQLERNP